MSTEIFYFSGTGNSLQVARDLASVLGETKITPISDAAKTEEVTSSAERVGIVYPVYMWGMPLLVSDFVNKLHIDNTHYIFAIATYGGMAGNALGQTSRQLESKGLRLSAGFAVLMPGNYTPLYGAIPDQQQQKMFTKERERIIEIASIVKEKRDTRIEKSNFFVNSIFSGLLYKALSPKIRRCDTSFWADERCNSCGICEKICPVKNIRMSNGKPTWDHRCEQCVACLQWCPQEAIQYGKKTSGRKRYHHPQVSLQDFIHS